MVDGAPAESASTTGRELIVDGMNVIGARPDGWWRDRDAAMRRFTDDLAVLAVAGQRVAVVFDGRPLRDLPEGERRGVIVFYAGRSGADAADDRIVDLIAGMPDPAQAEVVTSDRGLIERVEAHGARVSGPSALRRRISA